MDRRGSWHHGMDRISSGTCINIHRPMFRFSCILLVSSGDLLGLMIEDSIRL